MRGILKIAYKLLVNDKGKFAALLMGITFSRLPDDPDDLDVRRDDEEGVGDGDQHGREGLGHGPRGHQRGQQHPDARLRPRRRAQHRRASSTRCRSTRAAASSGCADGAYQAVTVLGLDDTSLFGRPKLIEGQDRGHLRRERLHRRQGRGVPQAREPEDRDRVRDQRQPRRHRRHRQGPGQRALRDPDALHDVQPRHPVHPVDALHDLVRPRRAAERRGHPAHPAGGRAARLRRAHRAGVHRPDHRLVHVSTRAWGRTSSS